MAKPVFAGTGSHSQIHISVSIAAVVGVSHTEPHQLHQTAPSMESQLCMPWDTEAWNSNAATVASTAQHKRKQREPSPFWLDKKKPGAIKRGEEGGRGGETISE